MRTGNIGRRLLVGIVGAALVAGSLIAAPAAFAVEAEAAPAAKVYPEPVRADALPTVQIDRGVVWTQRVVGNTVYAGGEFSNARPAGAAAGTSLMPRANILAYDIRTGVATSFNPGTNGRVSDMAVTPDGSKLIIVGQFTQVAGQTRNRIAVFNLPSGTLSNTIVPSLNGTARGVVASNDTIYVGGIFTAANNVERLRFAALNMNASGAAAVLPLNPTIPDGNVQAMVLNPDFSQIVISGSFTSMNGSNEPGYGLARLNTATGAMLPLPVNSEVRNAGENSSVISLATDGQYFYGSGWHYGRGGNMEGSFKAKWSDGTMEWIEDCHGDTYQVFPIGELVYSASHKHYCGNSGGFPQTEPWSFYHSTVMTKSVEGTNTGDIYGYPDHPGKPRPEILNWYPQTDMGTFTGQNQAVWTVNGNADYIVYGGEFPKVNGAVQQGLVRYAVRSIAPNKSKPVLNTAKWVPAVVSPYASTVRFTYVTNWDRDDSKLTYRVYRDTENAAGLIDERVIDTTFWKQQRTTITDTGRVPGSSVRYRVVASDPDGNTAKSDWITVTISDAAVSPYAQQIFGDDAVNYWRLGESSGTTASDWVSGADLTLTDPVTRGTDGAITGDSNLAATFNGGYGASPTSQVAPDSFTVEAWIKTTTTSGGKIIGFGNAATGNSSNYDRQVYMDNAGKIWFGVHPGGVRTVNSAASFNDGQWHHIVASLGADGQKLYVDGKRVGQRTDVTSGQPFSGYWRVGGDNLGGWPNQPSSAYFAGQIDEVAVYAAPLSIQRVMSHYTASGRTLNVPAAPADAYGALVYGAQPELFWRYDETTGSNVSDASVQGVPAELSGDYSRNQAGALAGNVGKSITFKSTTCQWWQPNCTATNGGHAYSTVGFPSPSTYSLETWFKTSSTAGGKIIGFGSSQTGTSGSYDRHVYMQDDGKLVFGTWTGVTNTITTNNSFNNNEWHHMVAMQGSSGMKLFVDGVLQGTNPTTGAQDYSGYWRVGGDTTWGSSSAFLLGSYDETAVYSRTLSDGEVATHYAVGKGTPIPNAVPTAAFTASTDSLTVSVDASTSTDSDGTISAYEWNFGDGGTSTGQTASHTYLAEGTYTVSLTVRDDDNATNTTTQTVTVDAPNVAPTASFTAVANGLLLDVDGTTSFDPDGTIASYEWNFGDGTTGTGPTASHPYAAGGQFTVTLKVTDNEGLSHTKTAVVSIVAPNQPPVASFTTSVSGLSVGVNGGGSSDPDGTVASYAWAFGDGGTGTGVTASHPYAAAGTYTVTLTVTDNSGASSSTSQSVTVTAPVGGAVVAADDFERALASGWGSAVTGGAWSLSAAASNFTVADGAGRMIGGAGATRIATLNTVSTTDTVTQTTFSFDGQPAGGPQSVDVIGRQVGSALYSARVRVDAAGAVRVFALRGETALVSAVALPSTYAAGQKLTVKLSVTGTSPTQVQVKVWRDGEAEPTAWTLTATDSTAELQAAGRVGLKTSISSVSTAGTSTVSFHDYRVNASQ